jgi:hypothetical protein
MPRSRRSAHLTIALLVALLLAAAATVACSARATAESGGALSPSAAESSGDGTSGASASGASASGSPASAAGAKAAAGADWARVLKALGYMQAVPPDKPVVVLLGGSAARESTIDDANWRAQIVAKGGPQTLAWNMGSRNRTMAENVAIVENLPDGAQAIVFIGINLGSFTQKSASVSLPSPLPTGRPGLKQPHQYSTKTGILSTTKKRALVKAWLTDRYPIFKRNFKTNAAELEELIQLCKGRGYYPVLFELPRNTAVIGSSLNAPTTKYREKCRALAADHDIEWVSFVAAARLPNSSFYDLWHLVEPGRKTWQNLLSSRTAKILKSDAFQHGGGGS